MSNKQAKASTFEQLCEQRYSRRAFIKASSASVAALTLNACDSQKTNSQLVQANVADKPSFDFAEVPHAIDAYHQVALEHKINVLLRWGDALFDDSAEFELANQSAKKQLKQFGYNNDYIGYLSLAPEQGQQARALLCINHEYPLYYLMFPELTELKSLAEDLTEEQAKTSQAAVGNSIVEVVLNKGQWSVNTASQYNRRISALDTKISISGPLAGHARMKTSTDPEAKEVIGTFGNCAGGMTPWGTFLSCEENFNYNFAGELEHKHPEQRNYKELGVPRDYAYWAKYDKRFDLGQEPNEPNRFGWVVEIDPLAPNSTPKKRTALGRFKHEGAENVIAPDGRLVVYMGDDEAFKYIFKFVSRDKVDLNNKNANKDLLDHGTLYVAKFNADGSLQWLPLTHENKSLNQAFDSLADILLEPRHAASLLGATLMDRPESVVPNKLTGKVYIMLSNNLKRAKTNAANPRRANMFGHIVEISEPDGNFASQQSSWDMLVQCGNPSSKLHNAQWNSATTKNGWFASPDNAAIDPSGRLWVSSDQGKKSLISGTNDGLWALETQGSLRGTGKMFFRAPKGAEVTGPVFSDSGEDLFLAIQHPNDSGKALNKTIAYWPDFKQGQAPRPSVIVIRREKGGKVG